MGLLRRAWLTIASELAWRIPGRPQRLLAAFALAERGSMLDMLSAVELTQRRDLRKKYFRHALDEARHAALFAGRVRALGRGDRAEAALEDSGQLVEGGFVGGQTLFERLGEEEFLSFVYVAEADAVEQFEVYLTRRLPDPETCATLGRILKDEHFHVSYTRAEVERAAAAGRPMARSAAMHRWRRVWQGWLRFTRDFGARMAGVWLGLAYLIAVGPFRLLARLEPGGWQRPERGLSTLAAARSES
jgi:hypothetical protein